jgi:hypothetical protein
MISLLSNDDNDKPKELELFIIGFVQWLRNFLTIREREITIIITNKNLHT